MLTDPFSKLGLVELAGCEREDKSYYLFLEGFDTEVVQPEEEIHGLESDAFVPVNERMVVGETKTIGRGKRGKIGVRTVVVSVFGTFKRRFKETPIPKSGRAAVRFDLIRMDGKNMYESKPTRFGHFASSRMALRKRLAPSA